MEWIHELDRVLRWFVWLPDWVAANEQDIELGAVWMTLITTIILGITGITLFLGLLGSYDGTGFGRAMKGFTLLIGVYGLSRSILWGTSLYIYYTGDMPGVYERTALRVFIAATSLVLSVVLIWVIREYHKENWGRPGPVRKLRRNRKVRSS